MEKTYKCKNGIIVVTLPESCDRDALRKATEIFLKKAMREEQKYVNSNTRRDFRKEQILH